MVYLSLMLYWTGNAFEGFEAQRFWGVHSVLNLINAPGFLWAFFTPIELHAFRDGMLDRIAFMLLIYSLPVMWRQDRLLLSWTYALGVVPAMSGMFSSFIRFESIAFPVFVAAGISLSQQRGRWPTAAVLGLAAILHVVLVWNFVNFRWAG
jgi:hypothetical protein